MTKKFYFLSLFLGLVCGMCFTSCCDTDDVTPIVPGGGGEEVTLYLDDEALPAGIIDPTTGTIQLTEGGELTLPFVVEPAELASKIVLSSADPSIVEVNGMKLIAKKPGKTTIYATAGNYTMQYDVNVKEKEKEKEKEVQIADTYLAWKADQLVETDIPEGAIVVTPSTVSTGANLVCSSAATFVIEGEVTLGKITLNADVNLIIKDGAKLTAQRISGNGKNLSIFGQAQMTGELVVSSDDDAISSLTKLEVHSAKVTASSSSNYRGGFFYIETFNVYGGSVDAKNTAEDGGYGIGLKAGGYMNIYGGEVKAVGKGNGTQSNGIHGGDDSDKATVTVYGGKLWAENADNKALKSINLTTGAGYTGTIRYSSDKTFWSGTADPNAKYVKVEKSQGGGS